MQGSAQVEALDLQNLHLYFYYKYSNTLTS